MSTAVAIAEVQIVQPADIETYRLWKALQDTEARAKENHKDRQKAGLKLGKHLAELKAGAEKVQGGSTFRATLDHYNIPANTAYRWMHRYEASIGIKPPRSESFRYSAIVGKLRDLSKELSSDSIVNLVSKLNDKPEVDAAIKAAAKSLDRLLATRNSDILLKQAAVLKDAGHVSTEIEDTDAQESQDGEYLIDDSPALPRMPKQKPINIPTGLSQDDIESFISFCITRGDVPIRRTRNDLVRFAKALNRAGYTRLGNPWTAYDVGKVWSNDDVKTWDDVTVARFLGMAGVEEAPIHVNHSPTR